MKIYVNVYAVFDTYGQIRPRVIIWEDGRRYPIDRIMSVERRACLRSGGAGLRYHINVCGKERYLFLEDTRWFVEIK